MFSFKKVFFDLYDIKKNWIIKDFDIYTCTYDYDYLLKYWKKKNFKRFIVNYYDLKNKKYNINFNNDLSKTRDLKKEIIEQMKNDFEILNLI